MDCVASDVIPEDRQNKDLSIGLTMVSLLQKVIDQSQGISRSSMGLFEIPDNVLGRYCVVLLSYLTFLHFFTHLTDA